MGCDLVLIGAISGSFRHTLHADNASVVCPRHGNNAEQLIALGCQCEDANATPNHTAWRKYTALLYLDSDHDGGNIIFGEGPNIFGKIYRKEITVKSRLLVLFPSNEFYYHRTTFVTRGIRYSIYNPRFVGWGYEDTEFYHRLSTVNCEVKEWHKTEESKHAVIMDLGMPRLSEAEARSWSRSYFGYRDDEPRFITFKDLANRDQLKQYDKSKDFMYP